MKSLEKIAQSQASWALEEFVRITNALLPQFLPEQKTNTRVREEVTPRLVRHYTTLNMLDEPFKEGREARYTYRHLLQVLVVRRLLAEGYSAGAIDKLATQNNNSELEVLLQGDAQLTIAPTNPALAFLHQIQERQGMSVSPKITKSAPKGEQHLASSNSQPLQSSSVWRRLEILPGLEVHVREDFSYPSSLEEQKKLLQSISQQLMTFLNYRRSSR